MHIHRMPRLQLGDLTVQLPIIQGGMGVGISRAGLASAVANQGGIGVIAEVEYSRIETRRSQGWVSLVSDKLDQIAAWMRRCSAR